MDTQELGHFTGEQASSPPSAGSCFPLLCWRCKPLLHSGCFAAGSGDKHCQPDLRSLPLEEIRQCCPLPVSAAMEMPQNTLPGLHHLLQVGQGLLADSVVSLGHLKCIGGLHECIAHWGGSSGTHPQVNILWKSTDFLRENLSRGHDVFSRNWMGLLVSLPGPAGYITPKT